MLTIPRRITLSGQLAAAIRQGIEKGVWADYLPGERRLCETFKASRPTVHAALRVLEKEGWFEIKQGQRNMLRKNHRPANRTTAKPSIGIVVHESFSHLGPTLAQGLGEVRLHLAEQGVATEVYVCPTHGVRTQLRGLTSFLQQNRISSCVLVSTSGAVQRWFCDQRIPALVLGSCHASVQLPSFDIDYRAVCQHAAGVFLSKGHRRLAAIMPDFGLAGDLVSELSFRETVAKAKEKDATVSIIRHRGNARSLSAKLDLILRTENPPTGLFVARAQYMVVALLHLLRRGLGVPMDLSLISRDSDPVFQSAEPLLTHYAFESDLYIRQLSRLIMQMATEELPTKPYYIMPKFILGQTVQDLRRTANRGA